jgi:hypothetical protein
MSLRLLTSTPATGTAGGAGVAVGSDVIVITMEGVSVNDPSGNIVSVIVDC